MSKEQFREKQLKYWRRRNAELSKIVDAEADEVIKNMREAYDTAAIHIDQQITSWYQKFADDNEISFQKAKEILDAGELKDFKMTLEEYIQHGEQLDEDPSWLKAMKNASSKHHITRLDALKMTAQAELEEAAAKIDGSWIGRAAEKAYLHALYSAQLSVGVAFNAPNIERVVRAAKKPWTPDGMEFVERKMVNNAKLVQKVQREITQAAITGEKYETLAERLSKDFALTEYESMRIIRTESTHLETEASMQAYKDCSIDRYQVLVTLDKRTCETCAEMDQTVWKISDRMDGYNAPPFHPNCRCTTIAYFDDPELAGTRAARNAEGKTVFIDDSMSYSDWLEEYGGDAAEDTELIVFKPAKSLEEAQEYAQRYISPYFMDNTFKGEANFKGISLDHANEINQALTEAFEQLPELEKLSGIKTVSPTSKQGKKAFKDGADALFSYDPIQHGIYINKDLIKDAESFADHLKKEQEAWDLVMDNLDKLSGAQRELAERYAAAGRSLVSGGNVKDLFTHELGHHVQWTMLDVKTTNSLGSKMKQYAPKISGYAQASGSEYFAESFVAYMKGEQKLLDPEYVKFIDSKIKKGILIGGAGEPEAAMTFKALLEANAVKVMRDEYAPWVESLSKKELHALRKYSKNSLKEDPEKKFYARLNAMLRGDTPEDPELREYAELISNALKRKPLENDIYCYRNLDIDPFEGIAVGDKVPGKQFFSTSVVESRTMPGDYHLTIMVPKGTPGAYIEKISRVPSQREFLIDKDCEYRVISRRGKDILLEVVI